MATDHETRHRAIRATKLISQLRLDLAAFDNNACDPDAAFMLTRAYALTPPQWEALALRAGIKPPSDETIDMVHTLLTATVDIEERYSTLPIAMSHLL